MFFVVVLGIWTLMHLYVGWRVWALPLLPGAAAHVALVVAFAVLWAAYPVGRMLAHRGLDQLAYPFELAGGLWMGVLFFALASLLVADLVTGFGLLLPRASIPARMVALVATALLAAAATVQGVRPPGVRTWTVRLEGLPAALDGTRLVQLSDLHVGALLGRSWLARLAGTVDALEPDVIVVTGDLVDGDARKVEEVLPELRRLRAPLGVWAVTGNHEFYAGLDRSVALLRDAGYTVLRDRTAEVAPGLVFAGVDDLTARRQFGLEDDAVERTLASRPPGATVLLCHTPWNAEDAAERGVGLMLSGHTHGGQIWPFDHLVKLTYPYVAGLYRVGGMTLLVSRGTGTWGPRMRLWRRAEINLVVLAAADSGGSTETPSAPAGAR